MTCPHCHKEINDAEIARHLASKGGSSGTGKAKTRTREQAQAAVMARIKKHGQRRRKLEKKVRKER